MWCVTVDVFDVLCIVCILCYTNKEITTTTTKSTIAAIATVRTTTAATTTNMAPLTTQPNVLQCSYIAYYLSIHVYKLHIIKTVLSNMGQATTRFTITSTAVIANVDLHKDI